MKKLKLQMDELAVDSFPTAEVEADAGTVEAREALNPSIYPYCTHGTYPCKTSLSMCPCTETD
jgi:hypothetical protein